MRNYGFIEKEFDRYRQLYFLLEKFLQAVNEAMLIRSDMLFREALRVYCNLRELLRAWVPGADPLYRALLQFFRRRRTAETVEVEPTIKQMEKDFNKLIHGHTDGDIEIINKSPKVTAGVCKVVDNVQKSRAAVKETAEAEINDKKW